MGGNQGGASGGNDSISGEAATSRKRPSIQQHDSEGFDNNGVLKTKIKKSKPSPNIGQAGPSSAAEADNAGNMVVKAEEVNLEIEDDSYQDYAEAELDEPFDESAYQDHDGAGADNFPTDSKG